MLFALALYSFFSTTLRDLPEKNVSEITHGTQNLNAINQLLRSMQSVHSMRIDRLRIFTTAADPSLRVHRPDTADGCKSASTIDRIMEPCNAALRHVLLYTLNSNQVTSNGAEQIKNNVRKLDPEYFCKKCLYAAHCSVCEMKWPR